MFLGNALLHIPVSIFSCRSKRQATGRNRVSSSCGSPTHRRRVCTGLWSVQKCSHFLMNRCFLSTSVKFSLLFCEFQDRLQQFVTPGRFWTTAFGQDGTKESANKVIQEGGLRFSCVSCALQTKPYMFSSN